MYKKILKYINSVVFFTITISMGTSLLFGIALVLLFKADHRVFTVETDVNGILNISIDSQGFGLSNAILVIIFIISLFLISFFSKSLSKSLAKKIVNPLQVVDFNDEKTKLQELVSEYPELLPFTNRLKDQARQRHEFSANVSHELKSPIAVILNCTNYLSKSLSNQNQDTVQMLELLSSSTYNLSNLVDAILRLSKFDEGSYLLDKKPTKLIELMDDVISNNYSEIEAKKLNITCDYSISDDLEIDVDRSLMFEAIANLIGNAIKYGKNCIRIEIIGTQHPDHKNKSIPMCEIVIKNDGNQIPEADIDHIFERFYRVDKSHNRNNSSYGIGLSIVKRILEAHSGYVYCKNDNDGFVSFHLLLPIIVF